MFIYLGSSDAHVQTLNTPVSKTTRQCISIHYKKKKKKAQSLVFCNSIRKETNREFIRHTSILHILKGLKVLSRIRSNTFSLHLRQPIKVGNKNKSLEIPGWWRVFMNKSPLRDQQDWRTGFCRYTQSMVWKRSN